jgi:hypothetical protein
MSVQGVGSIPACGTRYVAPYKRDFQRGSRTGGFFRALRFPPPSKRSDSPNVLGRRDSVAAVLSPRRVDSLNFTGKPVIKNFNKNYNHKTKLLI